MLDRVVYSSPETAWSVARFRVPGLGVVTAVGNLFAVHAGENVRLTGRWVDHQKHGRQFEVERYLTVQPSTVVGIERYLGSGLVPGIGKVMAKRLVAAFGLETLEVIEQQPGRLVEVDGIGPIRATRILEAWREQREIQQVMIFLQSHGVSTHYAVKIFRQYGDDAVRVVSEDPFRLAIDIRGIGFRTADEIAASLGLAPDAPQRVAAGILHCLSEAAKQGHLYLPHAELGQRACELLAVEAPHTDSALDTLLRDGQIIADQDEGGACIYVRSLFLAERGLASQLQRLSDHPGRPLDVDPDAACESFERRHRIELAPEQRQVIARVVAGKVVIVTGGPGTGKTTLVRALVEVFTRAAQRVVLAAPTGRAAKRLQEATGTDASTIHRLLEFSPREMRFGRDPDHPLDADVVVIDEMSMVDTTLAHHLVKAIPPHARLVIVGDADQLPSVGPGRVLRDLLASCIFDSVRLTRIFRQSHDSLIVDNAHRILHGEMPRLPTGAEGDFFVVEKDEPADVTDAVRRLVATRIPRRFGLHARDQIQVLTPMRRGPLGTWRLNEELQELLNPDGRPAGPPQRKLRIGDKVIQTRNDYQLDVFNGDLGTIVDWDDEDQRLTVEIDGRPIAYDGRNLDALELAYACSIHKSQGSEYPAIVLVVHQQHYIMLQRSLLYTAVTRGKQLVVVVGQKRAIARAVRNATPQARNTRLADRLRTAAG